MPSVHPLTGIELRALRRLQREQKLGRYVFMSERGAPMSAVAFRRMVTRLGPAAKMPFGIHPPMLRHSTGSSWPIRVWVLGRCNTISATRTSSTPSDTASFRRIVFETSGKTKPRSAAGRVGRVARANLPRAISRHSDWRRRTFDGAAAAWPPRGGLGKPRRSAPSQEPPERVHDSYPACEWHHSRISLMPPAVWPAQSTQT